MLRIGLCILFFPFLISTATAQQTGGELTEQETGSPEALIDAFYATLSGKPGPRDWRRLRSLCLPKAAINAIRYKDGQAVVKTGSVDDYIANTSAFFKTSGYYQEQRGIVSYHYEHLAHVYSAYVLRIEYNGGSKVIEERGIASFQMVYDYGRWWISGITWNMEKEGVEILLPAEGSASIEVPPPSNDTASRPMMRYESGVEGMIYAEYEVDAAPEYKGGDKAIFDYLGNNMLVPENAAEAAKGGPMTLSFIVDSNGYITNVTSANAPSNGWFFSALQALTAMPAWTPGQKNGKAVNTRVELSLKVGK